MGAQRGPLGRALNPTAAFAVLDARAIGTLPTRFDGIMCGFCVPYLAREDVTRLVQDCARLLAQRFFIARKG